MPGLSRHHVIASVEASLRRLQVDHIDLMQVHEWDGETPLEETLDALERLVQDGKVRYVGASNYTAWQLMKALAIQDARGYQRFVSQQIHYTPQAREAEFEILPAGRRPGRRHARLEPAGRRPAVGQVPPRQRGPEGRATPPTGTSRPSTTRTRSGT